MELSSSTLTGLEAAASSTISDNAYARLVAAVFQCALGLADQSVVEGENLNYVCSVEYIRLLVFDYQIINIVTRQRSPACSQFGEASRLIT